MKPETIELSDALREMMAQSMRDTESYRKLIGWRRILPQQLIDAGAIKRLTCDDKGYVGGEVRDALFRKLWEERAALPPALADEVERLNQAMLNVATAEGCPAIVLRNLPRGPEGLLASVALSSIAANSPKDTRAMFQDLRTPWIRMVLREHQLMHRDDSALSMLCGIAVGERAYTTRFADAEETIDAIARHYQALRDQKPLGTPLNPEVRDYVIQQLQKGDAPTYRSWDNEIFPKRMLADDQQARPDREWPKPYNLIGAFETSRPYRPAAEDDEMLVEAVNLARTSLKDADDGIVIGPGELAMWNNNVLVHAIGKHVKDPRAKKGEARHLLGLTVDTKHDARGGLILFDEFAPPSVTDRASVSR